MNNYKGFTDRFKLLAIKRRDLMINTLSNIFTMCLIGNKTHGDLAEISVAEFINQFMYDLFMLAKTYLEQKNMKKTLLLLTN